MNDSSSAPRGAEPPPIGEDFLSLARLVASRIPIEDRDPSIPWTAHARRALDPLR